jgi:hypothetical protein
VKDKCSYPGCNAHYDAKKEYPPKDGKPGGTGWYWPDEDAPGTLVHDHRLSDPALDPPKDWYEAFSDAAHDIHPGWTWQIDLTPEEEAEAEARADKVAIRPEAERRG